jgi:hypothetical protein
MCVQCLFKQKKDEPSSQKFAVSAEGEESQDEEDEWVGATSDNTDIIVLHRYFEKNADKIGKELLSQSDTNREAELSAAAGKRSWDMLCALLVDLGQSIEAPRLSHVLAAEHTEYINLMAKYAHRNVEPVRHLFVEGAVSSVSLPLIYLFRNYSLIALSFRMIQHISCYTSRKLMWKPWR